MPEHADVTTQAKTTTPETPAEAQVANEQAPAAAGHVWDILQQSIGNQAVGRLVEAQRAAAGEGVTPVSPRQQRDIDRARSGGDRSLAGAPGVRLHTGLEPARLARGLQARAFTQGSDVFLGPNVDPASESGQTTLAHELTHVAEGATAAGSVQREGEDPRANKPAENYTTPAGEERYNLTLSDGIHDNLSKGQALAVLQGVYGSQKRALEMDKGEWDIIQKDRKTLIGMVGGTLVDLGGMTFPDYDTCWMEPEKQIEKVRLALFDGNIKAAAESMKTTHEAWLKGHNEWMKYKNQLDDAALKAEIGIVVVAVVAIMVVAAVATVAGGGAIAVAGTETGVGSGGIAGGTTAAGTEAGATTATAAGTETATTTATAAGTETGATTTATTTATETGATTATETAGTTTGTGAGGGGTGAGGGGTGAGNASWATDVAVGSAHAAEVSEGITGLTATLEASGEAAATEAAGAYSVEVLEGMMANLTKVAMSGSSTARAVAAANALYKIVEAAYRLKRGF